MSKMPIAWHEECYKNATFHVAGRVEHLERELELAKRRVREVEFYGIQIETAKKKGKDGFDADKFMINKLKEYVEGVTV